MVPIRSLALPVAIGAYRAARLVLIARGLHKNTCMCRSPFFRRLDPAHLGIERGIRERQPVSPGLLACVAVPQKIASQTFNRDRGGQDT